jgi:hypothetical protein
LRRGRRDDQPERLVLVVQQEVLICRPAASLRPRSLELADRLSSSA